MARIRTFVAVELSDQVRRRAAKLIEKLSAEGANVKWVAHDNLHLTLNFLGDVEDREVPRVCQTVQTAADGMDAFGVSFVTVGAFPNPQRPRTIWIGVEEGKEALCKLQSAIAKKLAADGYPQETRKYHPHLTLGRVRKGGRLPELCELIRAHASFAAGTAQISEVVVFSSDLESGGPVYHPLSRVPLA